MRGAPVQRKAEWGHRLRFGSEAVLEQFCARHCGNMSGMMLPSSVHGSGAEEERHPAALPVCHKVILHGHCLQCHLGQASCLPMKSPAL